MNGARRFVRRIAGCRVSACIVALCFVLAGASASVAHELRPAYLQLTEGTPGMFDVLFKTPMRGEFRLALDVRFSGPNEVTAPMEARVLDDAMVQTWRIRTLESLAGQDLWIEGLENTMTDALVRIEFANGTALVQRLTPAQPRVTIPLRQAGWNVAQTYFGLGIEHILLGIDHLFFVLGLMLITGSARQLVMAITAFTIAHCITLAIATLGFVHVPPRPVEATIALSIVFVAVEIVRARQGKLGLAARIPWLVAFAFGLLHGLGFAGALGKIGMPAGRIPEALLFFNIGVEIGQLLFVAAVLFVIVLLRKNRLSLPRWAAYVPPYVIGSVAMFWAIQRVAAI